MIENKKKTTATKKRVSREQKGYFHVILKSNFQVNIFEDKEETDMFMHLFYKHAPNYSSTLLGYVLMTTHVHLVIYSEQLSKFIQTWLRIFAKYRNKRYRTSGKIFLTPFSSYHIPSQKNLIESIFYLYYNPIAEEICSHPAEYSECSYKYHYPDNNRKFHKNPNHAPTKNRYIPMNNNLNHIIDSSFIRNVYSSQAEFDKAFFEYVKMKKENKKMVSKDGRMTNAPISVVDKAGKFTSPPIELGDGNRPYTNKKFNTDTQILEYRNKILGKRSLSNLSLQEIDSIIIAMLKNTYANKRQIASVMMVTYEHVRKVHSQLNV